MKLIPVDGDPFAEDQKKGYKLRAVQGNPFADEAVTPEDPGAFQAGLIGAGRMLDRLNKGAQQIQIGIPNAIAQSLGGAPDPRLQAMAQEEDANTKAYAPLQKQHPIATTLGESAPLMALPLGGSLKTAATISAIPGLLEYGTPSEKGMRGASGAFGGGIGYGVGKAIGAVASPSMKASSPEAERLARVAADNNIPLDVAQITGNPVLQNTKAALGAIPWTAGGQQARDAAKQEAFNKAVLKYVNSEGKAATPDVMADAHSAMIQKMNDAAGSVALQADDKFVDQLANVEKTYLRRLPTDQKPVIASYLDDLTNLIGKADGLPGDVYNKTRSELGRIAASTQNNTVREGAKGLQKVIDDAFDRQAPKDAVTAMKEARAEYSKYLTITEATKKARAQDGNIPPKQLYAQAQQDIPGFERKTAGFPDLVRAGRQFLPDPIANSGTPQRMLYQNLLTAGAMSGLGATGGQMFGGDASSGAMAGLAGFGVSKGAQGLLNSPMLTKYLMSHVLTEEQKKLLARSGGLLGLAAATGASP